MPIGYRCHHGAPGDEVCPQDMGPDGGPCRTGLGLVLGIEADHGQHSRLGSTRYRDLQCHDEVLEISWSRGDAREAGAVDRVEAGRGRWGARSEAARGQLQEIPQPARMSTTGMKLRGRDHFVKYGTNCTRPSRCAAKISASIRSPLSLTPGIGTFAVLSIQQLDPVVRAERSGRCRPPSGSTTAAGRCLSHARSKPQIDIAAD